jgi:hypothetical protein
VAALNLCRHGESGLQGQGLRQGSGGFLQSIDETIEPVENIEPTHVQAKEQIENKLQPVEQSESAELLQKDVKMNPMEKELGNIELELLKEKRIQQLESQPMGSCQLLLKLFSLCLWPSFCYVFLCMYWITFLIGYLGCSGLTTTR